MYAKAGIVTGAEIVDVIVPATASVRGREPGAYDRLNACGWTRRRAASTGASTDGPHTRALTLVRVRASVVAREHALPELSSCVFSRPLRI
eukprot:6178062-Pleurochrysis_carterae.AAC.3